jgi:hypothetical protein
MENGFSFNGKEVEVEKNGNSNLTQYAQPGIHEFQATSMELKAAPNGNKYMDCQFVNSNGEVASRQYYLTTNRNTPSRKSAFDISSESLKKLSVAIGREDMYNATTSTSQEEFVDKMSALFVGQWFRNKLKGKQIRKADGTTFIKGEMSDAFESISIPKAESRLKYDPIKDTKYLDGNTSDNVSPNVASKASVDTSDLPF